MLFDSHAHLDDERYDGDRDALIQQIHADGVSNIMNIGSSLKSSRASLALADKYDFIYASVGVHPSEVGELDDAGMAELEKMAKHPKARAIGEIGLDYHYFEDTDEEMQHRWLREQLSLAKNLDMPVIIHDRESRGECIEELKNMNISNGVMHCFSGSAETAKVLLKMGFHISFTGVLTFKNARRALEALAVIPMERLLIETDSPYMSPEPHRGERNHSGYVKYVAQKVAEVIGIDYGEVVEITDANAKRLFGIK